MTVAADAVVISVQAIHVRSADWGVRRHHRIVSLAAGAVEIAPAVWHRPGGRGDPEIPLDDACDPLAVALDVRVPAARVVRVDGLGEGVGAVGVAGREGHAVVIVQIVRAATAEGESNANTDPEVRPHRSRPALG